MLAAASHGADRRGSLTKAWACGLVNALPSSHIDGGLVPVGISASVEGLTPARKPAIKAMLVSIVTEQGNRI
jgi:hypothetical protein